MRDLDNEIYTEYEVPNGEKLAFEESHPRFAVRTALTCPIQYFNATPINDLETFKWCIDSTQRVWIMFDDKTVDCYMESPALSLCMDLIYRYDKANYEKVWQLLLKS